MNKLIYILTFIIIFGCSHSNKTEMIEKYSDGTPKYVHVYFNDNDSSNYLIKHYYENGSLDFEGKVSNEKFVEYKKVFYKNGKLKQIVTLSESTELDYCCPDGFYKNYYENGQIKETYHKKNGQYHGLATKYDSIGNKIAEYELANNLKNGITKKFHENGLIKSIKEYHYDTLVGTAYYFSENGDSLKRHETHKGKLDFPIKYWGAHGNTLTGEYFNNNYHRIKWIWRDSMGNITKTEISDTVNGQFVTPNY